MSSDHYSLARHAAGLYGWTDLHRGSPVPAGKELGNRHLVWLGPAGPWEHGGPSCGALGCSRRPSAPSQAGFKAWVRDPPRLYYVSVRIWGASNRTHSSLLRHKREYWKATGVSQNPRTGMLLGTQEWPTPGTGVLWGAQEVPTLLSLLSLSICFILTL